MSKKIPPPGWRPDRGKKQSNRPVYTTTCLFLQSLDGILPCLLALLDCLREVAA